MKILRVPDRTQLGVTLTEVLVVVGVVAILAAAAVPSFQDMLEKNRLKRVIESFKSDIQLARTRAIKNSQNVIVSRITGNAGAWCYGLAWEVTGKTDCDCTDTTPPLDCDIKVVSGASFDATDMNSGSANDIFDFRRGTIGNDGVTFSTDHYMARIVFSQVGRVRICTPTDANPDTPEDRNGLPGIPNC